MKNAFIAIGVGVLATACNTSIDKNESSPISKELDGKKLMEKNCFVCHNTQGTDNMLAPPMSRVKDHYWDDETTKDEFINDIVDWVDNPVEENVQMPGAVRKFGLMPKQVFNKDEVKAIAAYLYDNELDLESCKH